MRPFLMLLLAASIVAGCAPKKDDPAIREDVYVTGGGPSRILLDGDTAYVVDSVDNLVDVVDLHTCGTSQGSCERTARVQLEAGSGPFDGVVTSGTLFVAQTFADAVVKIEGGAVTATITTGAGFTLAGPQAVAAAGGKLFVANANGFGFGPGFVSVVQGTAITASIATTQLQPIGFATLPDGDLAVTNLGYVDFSSGSAVVTSAGGIDVIDPDTNAVVRNLPLGLTSPIGRPAIDATGTYGFVASGVGGQVMRVHLTTGAIDTIDVVAGPAFLSWTLVDGEKLYVLSYLEDLIYVYDVATLAPLATIEVGPGGDTPKGPSHAVVWDHHGEKHLLVLLSAAHSVTDVLLDEVQ